MRLCSHVPPGLPWQGAGPVSSSRASSVQEESFYGSQRDKRGQILCSLPLFSVDVFSPLPPSLSPAASPLRLLLSVWRAGCGNVAATRICVCVSVFLSMHVRLPPPLCSEGDRGQVPWIARSLLPLPSLFQSLPPSPLSADINTQGTAAKIPGKVVKILGGYWIEGERGWKDSRLFYLFRVHTVQSASFWLLQVLVDLRKKLMLKVKKQENLKVFFFKLESADVWLDVEWIWRQKRSECAQWPRKLYYRPLAPLERGEWERCDRAVRHNQENCRTPTKHIKCDFICSLIWVIGALPPMIFPYK